MYNAFISYSHAADGKLAPALQTALEKFAKPWYKVRNLNIFRDESSLTASPHLWDNIQLALQQSEYLIYMASPVSAASKWINKEIEYWLQHKSLEKLLIVLTDGEIIWDDEKKLFVDPDLNSLPLQLEKQFVEEPFYIDLRNSRSLEDLSLNNPIFKKEVLKLAAQLHGKEPKDLAGDEVSEHNKMIRLRNSAIATMAFFLLAAIYAAWFANNKRMEANENKKLADSSARVAILQGRIAREQRDSAVLERRRADTSAYIAKLQKDTAQLERDNAIEQQKIAVAEKVRAQANYLLSEAKSASDTDPTLGLRLAQEAMTVHPDPVIIAAAYKIYRDHSFYKIIATRERPIMSLANSPDGKYILAGSNDSTLTLYELSGKLIRKIKEPSRPFCVAFSPDGRYMLDGLKSGMARLYNLQGSLVREFNTNSLVEAVAFSPDSKTILTGSFDSTAALWDIDGRLIHRFKGHHDQVTAVSISPDGKKVLTGSYDGTARLWAIDGTFRKELTGGEIIYCVAFSPDGKYLITGSLDNTAAIWDSTGNLIRKLAGHTDAVLSVAFSPDSRYILTGSWDRTARIWDTAGIPIAMLKGNPTTVNAVFSADGKSVITAGGESVSMYPSPLDHTIRIWPMWKGYREINNHSGVIAAAFATDQKKIVTGSADSMIRVWGTNSKPLLAMHGHRGIVNDVAFSPGGKLILSGGADSIAKLWSLNGELASSFIGHTGVINSVCFSPDERSVLTASEDGTARLWDLHGNTTKTFVHEAAVRAAVFSPDGKYILTGTSRYGEVARLWKTDGTLVREYYDNGFSPLSFMVCLAFAPNGKSFITGMDDYKARWWSLSGNLLHEFAGHTQPVTGVRFSPDGKNIATACKDGTARIWDLKGNIVQELNGHSGAIFSVAFSKDGKYVLTGSIDRTARIWDVAIPLEKFLAGNELEPLNYEQKKQFGIK